MSESDDIGCEEALKRLLEFIDGELSDSEHDTVERHLRTCRSCFSRMEFERRLKQRLSALSADDVPAKSRDRIRDLIKGFDARNRLAAAKESPLLATWSDKKEFILKAVEEMYTDVASRPGAVFHFPTGRLACLYVGYPADQLDCLPAEATESFAGVGYPFVADVIREGDAVLDVGSGSGTDTLIAAMLVGPTGIVYGLDMTRAMREKLERNVAAMKIGNVRVVEGNAEQIPLPDASIDVVTSNGVLNLVPDKPAAFGEIARVLKPGGRLQISDIALRVPVSEQSRADPRLWAECVVGAIVEDDYVSLLRAAGLDVEVFGDLDYFAGSVSASTRRAAHGLGAHAIVMRGFKPRTSG